MAFIMHLIWADMRSETCFWVWIWIPTLLLNAFDAILPYSISALANNASWNRSWLTEIQMLCQLCWLKVPVIVVPVVGLRLKATYLGCHDAKIEDQKCWQTRMSIRTIQGWVEGSNSLCMKNRLTHNGFWIIYYQFSLWLQDSTTSRLLTLIHEVV